MKFDYYILNSYIPAADGEGPELYGKWIEQVTLAEELGFECVWFTEHHFGRFGGMLPSPPMLMAALAQCTHRIRLGTAVVLLPLNHPLRVAEELAMLDILSNGRLEVGVGRGMGTQPYRVFGTDPAEAQEKLEEQVEMLLAAWTEVPFRWEGKYYQCPNPIIVRPRPVQQPHPRLWVPTGREPAHSRWTGRHGFNLMTLPWLMGFDVSRQIIAEYRAGLWEAGHAESGREVFTYFAVHVGDTPQQARQEAEEYWLRWREVSDEERGGAPGPNILPYDQLIAESRLIIGDPDMCRWHVERILEEVSLDRMGLLFHFGGMPQELVLASMRRFAAEVAPCFAE